MEFKLYEKVKKIRLEQEDEGVSSTAIREISLVKDYMAPIHQAYTDAANGNMGCNENFYFEAGRFIPRLHEDDWVDVLYEGAVVAMQGRNQVWYYMFFDSECRLHSLHNVVAEYPIQHMYRKDNRKNSLSSVEKVMADLCALTIDWVCIYTLIMPGILSFTLA
ncbi:hypothetical protein LguiA_033402 [Lonicera macranthoides]